MLHDASASNPEDSNLFDHAMADANEVAQLLGKEQQLKYAPNNIIDPGIPPGWSPSPIQQKHLQFEIPPELQPNEQDKSNSLYHVARALKQRGKAQQQKRSMSTSLLPPMTSSKSGSAGNLTHSMRNSSTERERKDKILPRAVHRSIDGR